MRQIAIESIITILVYALLGCSGYFLYIYYTNSEKIVINKNINDIYNPYYSMDKPNIFEDNAKINKLTDKELKASDTLYSKPINTNIEYVETVSNENRMILEKAIKDTTLSYMKNKLVQYLQGKETGENLVGILKKIKQDYINTEESMYADSILERMGVIE